MIKYTKRFLIIRDIGSDNFFWYNFKRSGKCVAFGKLKDNLWLSGRADEFETEAVGSNPGVLKTFSRHELLIVKAVSFFLWTYFVKFHVSVCLYVFVCVWVVVRERKRVVVRERERVWVCVWESWNIISYPASNVPLNLFPLIHLFRSLLTEEYLFKRTHC